MVSELFVFIKQTFFIEIDSIFQKYDASFYFEI